MTMDIGTNSNAEPNPEVGSVEGASKQTGIPENPRAFEGVAVNPTGDTQNTTNNLGSLGNASASNRCPTAGLPHRVSHQMMFCPIAGFNTAGVSSDTPVKN